MSKKIQMFAPFIIVFFALFLRFYNFSNRWTLSQDQARDAIIGIYALNNKLLPLLGPPSSAGPFNFGPLYYWLIELFSLIIPGISGPWIGFTLLSTFSVLVFYFFGIRLLGKRFGFILGMVAAFASSDVFNAPDMLNPMLIGLCVAVVFFALQKVVGEGNSIFSLLLGAFIGIAINFHLQSIGLITILFLTLFFNKFSINEGFKIFILSVIGFITSFIPLIYFDILHKGAWLQSVIHYATSGQNKFNISQSWSNDLIKFWPKLWGEVITNFSISGYLLLGIFLISLILVFKNKYKIPSVTKIIFLSFVLQIILVHFYKGPRMSVYLIVYHPFFIFFTAFSIWVISKYQRILGFSIFVLLILICSYSDWKIINQSTQVPLILSIKRDLTKNLTGSYRIYSFKDSFNISLPLFYLLQKEGKISESGTKLGACDYYIKRAENLSEYDENCPSKENILAEKQQYKILNLSEIPDSTKDLFEVTPSNIYNWIYSNY